MHIYIYMCIYIYRLRVFSGNRISELHVYIYTHMYLLFIYDLHLYIYTEVACVQWESDLRITYIHICTHICLLFIHDSYV